MLCRRRIRVGTMWRFIKFRFKKFKHEFLNIFLFYNKQYVLLYVIILRGKRSRSVCSCGACVNNALQIEQSPRLRDLLFYPRHSTTVDAGNLRHRSLRRARLAASPAVATGENNNFYAPTFNSYKTCVNPFGWITKNKKKKIFFPSRPSYCIILLLLCI